MLLAVPTSRCMVLTCSFYNHYDEILIGPAYFICSNFDALYVVNTIRRSSKGRGHWPVHWWMDTHT